MSVFLFFLISTNCAMRNVFKYHKSGYLQMLRKLDFNLKFAFNLFNTVLSRSCYQNNNNSSPHYYGKKNNQHIRTV